VAQRTANWLQIKVVAGLGALLLGAAAIVGYLGLLAQENNASQELLSRVRQLDVQGQAIQRRGVTYANNAPRDFAPYERDMIIFYPDFMRDLNAFEKQLGEVATAAAAVPSGHLHEANTMLTESVEQMQAGWQRFRRGLQAKLGDNPAEPRLEWGAEYVRDNQALINNLTGALIRTVDKAIQGRLDKNAELTLTAVAGAGGLLLLGVIWFYLSVVRRISMTVSGCQRVAQGDFGYQLPERGNDELTTLARAFNSLSARTRFVLTMLSKMHRSGSAESKTESLWAEASGYLPMQWLGLWQANPADGSMRLLSLRSDKPIADAVMDSLENLARHDTQLLRMAMERQPAKVGKLAEYVLKTPNARLLRELVKIERLNSVLLVPLVSDDGWRGLLVFLAAAPAAYTDEQIELLGNLAPYMANGFAQARTETPKLAAA
jgi:nitrate/nitrite-specific signal transduction histidine kinase